MQAIKAVPGLDNADVELLLHVSAGDSKMTYKNALVRHSSCLVALLAELRWLPGPYQFTIRDKVYWWFVFSFSF